MNNVASIAGTKEAAAAAKTFKQDLNDINAASQRKDSALCIKAAGKAAADLEKFVKIDAMNFAICPQRIYHAFGYKSLRERIGNTNKTHKSCVIRWTKLKSSFERGRPYCIEDVKS